MTKKLREPVFINVDLTLGSNNKSENEEKDKKLNTSNKVKSNDNSLDNCNNTIKNNAPIHNFEDVLQHLGGFGNFQFLILVLMLILEVPTAFVTFIPIFVGRVPEMWTCNNETMSVEDICECDGSRFASDAEASRESIIAEWDLVCEKAWVFDFVTSIQMLGMFFGSVFGSQFADWYGRKYGFLGATLLLSLGSTISALAPNPYVYAVARFLCGAGITSFMNVTLVGVVEVMPPKWRSLSNCVGPTGEGIMILSLLAYFIRPWRELYWATIAPFILIIVIYPFVPESPRWLLKQNRVEEAHKALTYMAKVNRKSPVGLETIKKIAEKEKVGSESGETYRYSYIDFVRDKSLRITSIYNMAIWFAWSLTYYGISFNIKNIEGDIYLNVFFMGLANAVGQRAALLINDRLGRRKALFASMTFCAIFLVTLAICEIVIDHSKMPIVVVTLCLLGQFGMASARSAARLLSGESFPTAVRTMGMGIGGITANIAGILTPQLAYLGATWPSIPFFTFALVSVCGSLISFLMDETNGRPLDDVTPSTSTSTTTVSTISCEDPPPPSDLPHPNNKNELKEIKTMEMNKTSEQDPVIPYYSLEKSNESGGGIFNNKIVKDKVKDKNNRNQSVVLVSVTKIIQDDEIVSHSG